MSAGLRWKHQRDAYEESFDIYKVLIKAIAAHEVGKVLDEDDSDIDGAKRALLYILPESKKGIVESDINRRPEISHLERLRKKATQSKVARVAGTIAVAATVTAAGSQAAGLSPKFENIDSINSVGIGSGLGFAVGTLIRSKFRKGSIKLGEVMKRRVNSSIDFYDSPGIRQIMKKPASKGKKLSEEEVHEMLSDIICVTFWASSV